MPGIDPGRSGHARQRDEQSQNDSGGSPHDGFHYRIPEPKSFFIVFGDPAKARGSEGKNFDRNLFRGQVERALQLSRS
jgi:hypothetical protein